MKAWRKARNRFKMAACALARGASLAGACAWRSAQSNASSANSGGNLHDFNVAKQ